MPNTLRSNVVYFSSKREPVDKVYRKYKEFFIISKSCISQRIE